MILEYVCMFGPTINRYRRMKLVNFVSLLSLTSKCVVTARSSAGGQIDWHRLLQMASNQLVSADYEVFGKVQGVFFRKNTEAEAKKLNLKGWVRNTSRGTVEGTLQGPSEKVQKMKHWLKTVGSPKSKISDAVFKNEKDIPEYTFKDFDILSTK